jgi:RNA polymerase sigma factor (sigma-70 family)
MKLDREPTLPELAEATGLTIPKIQALYREKALEAGLVHLDEKVTPNSEMTWAESIPDLQAPSPSKQIEQESLKILINSALGELTARDRQILEMLYGAKPAKLREVGKSLDVSKQFIQIQQDKLLSKLKKKLSSKLAQPNQELSLATQFL